MEKREISSDNLKDFITHQQRALAAGDKLAEKILPIPNFVITGDLFIKEMVGALHILEFQDCVFKGKIKFEEIKLKDIEFRRCIFNDEFTADNLEAERLYFEECQFQILTIKNSSIEYVGATIIWANTLNIGEKSKIDTLIISSLRNATVEQLWFDTNSIQKKAVFRNLKLTYSIVNSGYTSQGNYKFIEFSSCQCQIIDLYEIFAGGTLRFVGIKNTAEKNSRFSIVGCSLGNSEFLEVDFASFTHLDILHSTINNCSFLNCNWGRYKNLNADISKFSYLGNGFIHHSNNKIFDILDKIPKVSVGTPIDAKKMAEIKMGIFRQLKFSYSKQGDKEQEKYLHALEHSQMLQYLDSGKYNLSKKVILRLSKDTSDFGLSLTKPLWLVLICLIIFTLMIKAHGIPGVTFCRPCQTNLLEGFAQFLNLLNPVHKLPEHFAGGLIIGDFAIRILSSYAIYNLIRASRRFIN